MDASLDLRRACLEDATAMALLSAQLGYPATDVEMHGRLTTVLTEAARHAVYVTTNSRGLTGWIHVMRLDRLEAPAHGEIAALVVDDALRGHGIGTQLVAASIEWARAQRLARLTVRARVEREDAHRFYRRIGFCMEKTQRVMTLAV